MLGHVVPGLSGNDSANDLGSHSKEGRKLLIAPVLSSMQASDFAYLACRHLGRGDSFATTATLRIHLLPTTPFAEHVTGVVALRAKEEMVRPYTRPVVAVMQAEYVRQNQAIGKFIGHAMRLDGLSMLYMKTPIPIPMTCRLPQPARVSLEDIGPEALCKGSDSVLVITGQRTMLAATFAYLGGRDCKRAGTSPADT